MEKQPKKDFWDKLNCSSPLFTGLLTAAVTIVGFRFTHVYSERQRLFQEMQEQRQVDLRERENRLAGIEFAARILPELASPDTRRPALVVLSRLESPPGLAAEIAETFGTATDIETLELLAVAAKKRPSNPAVDALARIAAASQHPTESEAARQTLTEIRVFPELAFSASPSSVAEGGATTLTWSGRNIAECTASGGWQGSRPVSGSFTAANLTKPTTFSLSCAGRSGSTQRSVHVAVNTQPTPAAPSVTLSAAPTAVPVNGSSTLVWTSTNTSSCTASGAWSGTKALQGSEATAALGNTAAFSLSCAGTGGSSSSSVTVTVVPGGGGGGGSDDEDSGGGLMSLAELLALLLGGLVTYAVGRQGRTAT